MLGIYILAAVLCVHTLLVQAVPAPGHGALAGYCITNEHCARDECCVSFVTPRGKRDLTSDLRRFVKGKCEKHGSTKSSCLVRNNNQQQDIYYVSCPCRVGLTCRGTGDFTVPLGERGTCGRRSSLYRPHS